MATAFDKLGALGPHLPYPHSSDVGAPAAYANCGHGRDIARGALYRRSSAELVIGAIGPEAQVSPASFHRAVQDALQRLADHEQGKHP